MPNNTFEVKSDNLSPMLSVSGDYEEVQSTMISIFKHFNYIGDIRFVSHQVLSHLPMTFKLRNVTRRVGINVSTNETHFHNRTYYPASSIASHQQKDLKILKTHETRVCLIKM